MQFVFLSMCVRSTQTDRCPALQAYEAAKGKGGLDGSGNLNEESVEALKEDVFAIVTGEYAKTEALIRNQVGGFVHFLDVMMAPEESAGEEE